MRPNDIKDLAFDVGLERPHIAVREEWDSTRTCLLSYGPLAYRKIEAIDAKLSDDEIRRKLEGLRPVQSDVPSVAMPIGGPPKEAFKPYVSAIAKDAVAQSLKATQKRKKAKNA